MGLFLLKILVGVAVGGAVLYVLTKDKVKKSVKNKIDDTKDKDLMSNAFKAKIKEKIKAGKTSKLKDLEDYDSKKDALVVDVFNNRNRKLAKVTLFADKIEDDIHVGDEILLN